MSSRTQARRRSRASAAPPASERGPPPAPTTRAGRTLHTLAAHETRTAAGLFALLVLAYLWPVLLGGGTLAPLAELYHLPPWEPFASPEIDRWVNPALFDVPVSYYPWDVLARQLIHAGTFPAWNPYALGGTPFFANLEVAWLSPFKLPVWILPLHYGFGVAAALKLWVAGFGTYLLARELQLGFWPGMLAGISFALCGFNMGWLSYGVFVSIAAMLPWAILLVERLVRRGRPVDGLALAGVGAVILTGGHPGTQVHVLAATVLYALVRIVVGTDAATRERVRRVALIGAGLALGALLTAVVVLPAQQAAIDSSGAAARAGGGIETFIGGSMPFGVLHSVAFPEWWGRSSELIAGPANYTERTFYAGAVALLLAVIALASAGGWRRKAPFVLLAALGAAAAVRMPGLQALLDTFPGFDRVQNHRMALWLQFGIAMLAGFGLQALLDAPAQLQRAWAVVAAAVAAALLAVATVGLGGDALGGGLRYMFHRAWSATPQLLVVASAGWWLVFVAAFAGILLLARRRPERLMLIGGLVVLVAALDMLHFAGGYQPMGPASEVAPRRTPAIAYLQRHADEGRVAGLKLALGPDTSTVFGLRDARGYDAPQPSMTFHRLWKQLESEQSLHGIYQFEAIPPSGLNVLSLLGVRYLMTEPDFKLPGGGRPAYSGKDAKVYLNAGAMPRAIVASRAQSTADEAEAIGLVAADGFVPRRDAVVRAEDLGGADLPAGPAGGSARVVSEANSRVTLRATLPRRGLVVLGDAWAPGWSVRVDDRPAQALQADVVLRGVVVPAGRHEIVWSYRVPGLRLGAMLSLLGLLIAAGWGAWIVVAARRRGGPDAG